LAGVTAAGTLLAGEAAANDETAETKALANLPEPIRQLRPMTGDVTPIADDERRVRIAKAQRLMAEQKIDAIYIESGSSMFYYTGVRWGGSERMFAVVIPARGELAWVCPKFEEERARELIKFGTDIRTWEEDESPYKVVAGIFKDRKIRAGRVGMEERTRFFLFDGIRREAPHLQYVAADPVTAGCRMFKSPAEIALMQRANDITIEAFKAARATLREGMTTNDLNNNLSAAFRQLGASGGALISFGKYTAFPHGSVVPQKLREGDLILMDGGTSVEGYASDVTRMFVFGQPTPRMNEIFALERKAQDAGFAAAQVGAPCEAVDYAARKVLTDAGFGPDYKTPGCPHRTGHGIGLDGHEWTNFVRGNKTKLQPGMCFSDEPTIVIYGEMGVRLEDCLYITENGPKFFTKQSDSLENPFS
jgi:Xaa-Pro dipeptidase